MNRLIVILFSLLFAVTASATESPYQSQQNRAIKALSLDEVTSLLAGEGMGFARAAELNRYPGPKHVLDMAEQLDLSHSQIRASQAIFDRMLVDAMALGQDLVGLERELDQAFAEGTLSEPGMTAQLADIGRTRAELRGVHLRAHLQQRDVLTAEQIDRYDSLRGYADGTDHSHHGH